MSIGNNIKKFRELRNYTQEYVAEQIGMSPSGYGKIERDATDVSINRLKQIAEVLEVDYNSILNLDKSQIFNITQTQNDKGTQNAFAYVKRQKLIGREGYEALVEKLEDEMTYLRNLVSKLQKT